MFFSILQTNGVLFQKCGMWKNYVAFAPPQSCSAGWNIVSPMTVRSCLAKDGYKLKRHFILLESHIHGNIVFTLLFPVHVIVPTRLIATNSFDRN